MPSMIYPSISAFAETLDIFPTFDLLRRSMATSPYLLLLLLIPVLPLSILLVLYLIVRPRPVRIPIKGRHVFITGGSSGIGLALARCVAAEGARVSLLARDPARLAEARENIRLATGVDPAVFSADVRDPAAVARALDEAGPVDVLICSHGVFLPQELELQDLEEIRLMVEVNLMGTFHLIKAALPAMKAHARATGLPASIALISSQSGQAGIYGYTAYSASKFALSGLGEALQHEVIEDNIHVSVVFPADTETPGFEEEKRRRPEMSHVIVGSMGLMKADDLAAVALSGIKSANFKVPCNFNGAMLCVVTAGMSPQSSFLTAFIEVFSAGFLRFIALWYQRYWFTAIKKWHAKKNKI